MPENISGPGRKYVGIDRSGKAALYQERAIKEFTGFPESLNNRFNVSLRFAPDSEALFRQRVTNPIGTIGEGLGIEFFLASRDFHIHSTLLEGLYEGLDPAEREEKFKQLRVSQAIDVVVRHLVGKTIEYKYLLIDKGNLLLTAINIPDWVLTTRADLTEAYTSQGLKPLLMTDILHISVARITRLPVEDRMSKLGKYRQRITGLRHQLSRDPLTLKVGAVSTIPPLDLLCH